MSARPTAPASGATVPGAAFLGASATASEVRRLGAVYLVAAAVLAGLSAWKMERHHPAHWPWQISLAALFAVLGLACLALGERARGIHRLWTAFGDLLGRVVSPLVLAALYFIVVTPFGLALRLVKGDRLGLRPDPKADTYWSEPAVGRTDRARMLRQY